MEKFTFNKRTICAIKMILICAFFQFSLILFYLNLICDFLSIGIFFPPFSFCVLPLFSFVFWLLTNYIHLLLILLYKLYMQFVLFMYFGIFCFFLFAINIFPCFLYPKINSFREKIDAKLKFFIFTCIFHFHRCVDVRK